MFAQKTNIDDMGTGKRNQTSNELLSIRHPAREMFVAFNAQTENMRGDGVNMENKFACELLGAVKFIRYIFPVVYFSTVVSSIYKHISPHQRANIVDISPWVIIYAK